MRYYRVRKCIRYCLPAILTFILFTSLLMIITDLKEDKLDFLDNDIQLVREERTTNKPRLKGNHKVLQNNVRDNAQDSKSHSDLGREKLSMNPYNLSCLYLLSCFSQLITFN